MKQCSQSLVVPPYSSYVLYTSPGWMANADIVLGRGDTSTGDCRAGAGARCAVFGVNTMVQKEFSSEL